MQSETTIQNKKVEINEDNPSVIVCVYGTLRSGNGNYTALLAGPVEDGTAELLGTFESASTYTMYGRKAGFPIVVDSGTTSITYEAYRITSNTVLRNLHGLEGCSGVPGSSKNWYDIAPIETPVGSAWIYVMHGIGHRSEESIITSGNWNDRNL